MSPALLLAAILAVPPTLSPVIRLPDSNAREPSVAGNGRSFFAVWELGGDIRGVQLFADGGTAGAGIRDLQRGGFTGFEHTSIAARDGGYTVGFVEVVDVLDEHPRAKFIDETGAGDAGFSIGGLQSTSYDRTSLASDPSGNFTLVAEAGGGSDGEFLVRSLDGANLGGGSSTIQGEIWLATPSPTGASSCCEGRRSSRCTRWQEISPRSGPSPTEAPFRRR